MTNSVVVAYIYIERNEHMNKKNYVGAVLVLSAGIFSVACFTENHYATGSGGNSGSNGVSSGSGEGGSVTTGNSSGGGVGGENSDVSSSSTGEPACIPITCERVNAECGEISDGCGNYINCGMCSKANNGWWECETERFENGKSLGIKPNICGGGCLYKDDIAAPIDCKTFFPDTNYDHYFWCVPDAETAFDNFGRCKYVGERPDASSYGADWCCQRAPE